MSHTAAPLLSRCCTGWGDLSFDPAVIARGPSGRQRRSSGPAVWPRRLPSCYKGSSDPATHLHSGRDRAARRRGSTLARDRRGSANGRDRAGLSSRLRPGLQGTAVQRRNRDSDRVVFRDRPGRRRDDRAALAHDLRRVRESRAGLRDRRRRWRSGFRQAYEVAPDAPAVLAWLHEAAIIRGEDEERIEIDYDAILTAPSARSKPSP